MNVANYKRIEAVASPACALFRPRRQRNAPTPTSKLNTSTDSPTAPVSVALYIVTGALLAFATNLSMHLLNLRMQDLGVSVLGIGVSVAIQALGIILVAPFAKYAIAGLGIRKSFLLGAFVTSSALVLFGLLPDPIVSGLLRLVFAGGLGLLFTISETLVITQTNASNRGKLVGWYTTALAVGTAAGPASVALTGVEGFIPLLCGALLFWLTIVPVLLHIDRSQELAPVVRRSTFEAVRILPIAFVTAFVFGVVDNGGLSMLSVFATLNGYDYSQAAMFAAIAVTGGIVMQIPLGQASHNTDPRMALLLCGVGGIVLLAILPNVISVHAAAMGISFVLGGLLEGLYTIGLICIAKYCRAIGISSANGCFVSVCGFGEFVGPLTTGTSIHYLGAGGFVVGLTLLLALYIIVVGCLKRSESLAYAG